MSNFNIAVECPECGEPIIKSFANFCGDYVPLSAFMCESWKCENCGCVCYTGDEDTMLMVDE